MSVCLSNREHISATIRPIVTKCLLLESNINHFHRSQNTLCLKKNDSDVTDVTDVIHYNFDAYAYQAILTICERVCYQVEIYIPTSRNNCFYTTSGNTETQKLHLRNAVLMFTPHRVQPVAA